MSRGIGRGTAFTKPLPPIEEVITEIEVRLDAIARRLQREAAARGEPWPPPPWEDIYAYGGDLVSDWIDEDDGDPAPLAQAAPLIDPHADAVRLLGQWHLPPEREP